MNDDELNQKIRDLDDRDDELAPAELAGIGKVVAYYGWYWRTVDFSSPITFAYCARQPGEGDTPNWVGFCENNKWNYETFTTTMEETKRVRELCVALALDPTPAAARRLFDYMQGVRPKDVTGLQRWDDPT